MLGVGQLMKMVDHQTDTVAGPVQDVNQPLQQGLGGAGDGLDIGIARSCLFGGKGGFQPGLVRGIVQIG